MINIGTNMAQNNFFSKKISQNYHQVFPSVKFQTNQIFVTSVSLLS